MNRISFLPLRWSCTPAITEKKNSIFERSGLGEAYRSTWSDGPALDDNDPKKNYPRVGRWLSIDPLESKYASFSPYNYVLNTPICAIDPDGKDVIIMIWHPTGKGSNGHVAIAVENYHKVLVSWEDEAGNLHYTYERQPDGTYTYYDFWPKAQVDTKLKVMTSVTGDCNSREVESLYLLLNTDQSISGKKGCVSEKGEGGLAPDIVYRISTTEAQDLEVRSTAESNENERYSARKFNCTTFAVDAIEDLFSEEIAKSLGQEYCESNGVGTTVCTPTELCRDLNQISQEGATNSPTVTIDANNGGSCPETPYLEIVHPKE